MSAGAGRRGPGNPSDFYPTPPGAAGALSEWYTEQFGWPVQVIDPSAGLGCLLVAWKDKPGVSVEGWESEGYLVDESIGAWDLVKAESPVLEGDGLKRLRAWAQFGKEGDPAAHLCGERGGVDRYPIEGSHDELVIANPPFSGADDWVEACVNLYELQRVPVAVLLRSQWIDDGNTKGRQRYRYETPPSAILRLPWRIRFNGAGADSCTYAWHVWHPDISPSGDRLSQSASASPMVPTFWAPVNGPAVEEAWVDFWERAAAVSRGD